mmetsp:Transcript_24978/g.58172  ORF Transcript_24978/g.58172 Transcript_24978/m.58172 type:complete len:185 (+) Transcript_24978:509-1063(+)
MAMLYLTPILPLGPVSYMCGSTRMALSSFLLAKIASLPLMLLYVFLGASAGTLLEKKDEETHVPLVVGGILLSICTIYGVTRYIQIELYKVLERQKKKSSTTGASAASTATTATMESNPTSSTSKQQQQKQEPPSSSSSSAMELEMQQPLKARQRRHVVSSSTAAITEEVVISIGNVHSQLKDK